MLCSFCNSVRSTIISLPSILALKNFVLSKKYLAHLWCHFQFSLLLNFLATEERNVTFSSPCIPTLLLGSLKKLFQTLVVPFPFVCILIQRRHLFIQNAQLKLQSFSLLLPLKDPVSKCL